MSNEEKTKEWYLEQQDIENERLSHFLNFMVYSYFHSYMDKKQSETCNADDISWMIDDLSDSIKTLISNDDSYSDFLYETLRDFAENDYTNEEVFREKYVEAWIDLDKIILKVLVIRFRKLMKMMITKEGMNELLEQESRLLVGLIRGAGNKILD